MQDAREQQTQQKKPKHGQKGAELQNTPREVKTTRPGRRGTEQRNVKNGRPKHPKKTPKIVGKKPGKTLSGTMKPLNISNVATIHKGIVKLPAHLAHKGFTIPST